MCSSHLGSRVIKASVSCMPWHLSRAWSGASADCRAPNEASKNESLERGRRAGEDKTAMSRSRRSQLENHSPTASSLSLAQRLQVTPQALGAGTRNEALDLAMRALPEGNRAREQRAARGCQLEPAAAPILGVDHHRDQPAPLQRLERGGA